MLDPGRDHTLIALAEGPGAASALPPFLLYPSSRQTAKSRTAQAKTDPLEGGCFRVCHVYHSGPETPASSKTAQPCWAVPAVYAQVKNRASTRGVQSPQSTQPALRAGQRPEGKEPHATGIVKGHVGVAHDGEQFPTSIA